MCNQNHLHCDQWRRRSLSNVQLSLKPHLKVKGKVSSIYTQGILCGCEGVCFLICKGQQRFSEVQKVLAAEREVKKYRRDERVQIWLVLPKWPKDWRWEGSGGMNQKIKRLSADICGISDTWEASNFMWVELENKSLEVKPKKIIMEPRYWRKCALIK